MGSLCFGFVPHLFFLAVEPGRADGGDPNTERREGEWGGGVPHIDPPPPHNNSLLHAAPMPYVDPRPHTDPHITLSPCPTPPPAPQTLQFLRSCRLEVGMKNNVNWELSTAIVARHFLKNVSCALRDVGSPSPQRGGRSGGSVCCGAVGFNEGREKMKGAGCWAMCGAL